MKDIDGKDLEIGDEILVVGSKLRHAVIINMDRTKVYSKFRDEGDRSRLQITKLSEQQIYKFNK